MQLLCELEHSERFKRENQTLEMVHLKLRTLIREVTAALRKEPDNQDLQERLGDLAKELAELECRAPWLAADYPVELAWWGPGPGVL